MSRKRMPRPHRARPGFGRRVPPTPRRRPVLVPAVVAGGLYVESRDGGPRWQPVPNDLLDPLAFAVDSGDADHPSAFAAGIGLFEITDPGRHCTQRQSGNWGSTAAYRDVDVVVLLAVGPQGLVRSGHGGASWEPLTKPGCAADSVRVGPCTPAGQLPGGQRRRTTTSKLGRERWRLRCW